MTSTEVVFAQVTTQGGGTGSTSPSGILFGDGTLHLKTVGIGANCTFSGGVLNCSGGGSSSTFSTTSLSAVAPLQYSQSPLAQFSITQSGTGGNGYLSSTDFNTFNNKISSTSLTVTTIGTSGAATYTPSTGVFNIPQYQAAGTYLTSVAVATANGFAGSSSGGATPSLTLTTTITGLLKGNGTAISAATPGTDYDVFAWPFTPVSYGNATGTLIGFTGGILSVGSSTFVGNGTTTGNHAFGSIRIPTLGVSAGTFIAVDPNGLIIATTTPQGSSGAFSPSANYGTVTGLPAYTSAAGVITEVGTGALSVDGNSPTVGQIVLVKNESGACTSSAGTCQNGLYNVTAAGSGIAAFVLTRNSNYNSSSNVIPGIVTYIISGATLADDFWALTTPAPITVGTTGLTYVEVSGGGAAVTSVSNSDSTLTISPTAGAVVASLNLAHSNTWSVLQNFSNATSTLFSSTYASTTNFFTSSITNTGVKSALVLNGATGLEGAYGGAAGCTNQVVTALSAVGATTCTTLAGAMFGNVTANTWFGNLTGAAGVPTFNATSTLFTGTSGQNAFFNGTGALLGTSTMSINTTTGQVTFKDFATGYSGIQSPVKALILQTGTTTTWTATTSNPYIPTTVAPFAGTIKDAKCVTDASYLGIEIDINGTAVAPNYFVASTTKGIITLTGSNTFNYGDTISMKVGTTTTATALIISCTLRTVQTT